MQATPPTRNGEKGRRDEAGRYTSAAAPSLGGGWSLADSGSHVLVRTCASIHGFPRFMRKRFLHPLVMGFLLALSLPGPAFAQPATPAAATARKPSASVPLAALFAAYWDEQAQLFPLAATAQGDNRYNDQLPNDQTRAFRQQQQRFYQQYQASLRKVDRAKLAAEDQVSYDVFRYQLEMALEGMQQFR